MSVPSFTTAEQAVESVEQQAQNIKDGRSRGWDMKLGAGNREVRFGAARVDHHPEGAIIGCAVGDSIRLWCNRKEIPKSKGGHDMFVEYNYDGRVHSLDRQRIIDFMSGVGLYVSYSQYPLNGF